MTPGPMKSRYERLSRFPSVSFRITPVSQMDTVLSGMAAMRGPRLIRGGGIHEANGGFGSEMTRLNAVRYLCALTSRKPAC